MAACIVGKGGQKSTKVISSSHKVRAEKSYMSMPEQDGSAKHKQFSMTMQLKMKTRPRAGHAEEVPRSGRTLAGRE
jgi:hypothetical protein